MGAMDVGIGSAVDRWGVIGIDHNAMCQPSCHRNRLGAAGPGPGEVLSVLGWRLNLVGQLLLPDAARGGGDRP